MTTLKGISDEELKRLLKDDPDFANILLNQKNITGMQGKIIKSNKKNKAPKKPINISKPKEDPPKPKQDPPKPNNISKPIKKTIVHKSNDPNNSKPLDPNKEEMCTDPKCTICEKPKPKPSNKPSSKPKNISNILEPNWLTRLAKLTPKYPKLAYVFDWYLGKQKGVTVPEVKDNILYYEKLRGKKEK